MIEIVIYLFIIGLILASFLTLVGMRLPVNQSIVKPRSHCDNCKHQLKWYELIPVFSYIIQNGKCRKCKKKLSMLYPLLEILSGTVFALAYIYFGISFDFFVTVLLCCLLVVIIVSDFNYMIILDSPLVIVSMLIVILKFYYYDFYHVLYGVVCGAGMLLFLLFVKFIGDKIFKKDSLGGGDIKLAFIFGLVLGVKYSFVALVIGCFCAFPYAFYNMSKDKNSEIPFGPFLMIGLLVTFCFMDLMNPILMLV